MERVRRVTGAVCIFALLIGATLIAGGDVSAEGPARLTKIIVPYTEYEWWLIQWADNEIVCTILVDHEGPPTVKEAISSCGLELATEWFYTPPCKVYQDKDTTTCQGLYIFLVSSQPKQREVLVELPPPVAWVNLEGCTPMPPENLCPTLPVLVLTGEEPLPDEEIVAIQGTYDGAPFYCPGNICKLPLHSSPLQGSTIEFWADSSYGDSSERYVALVRAIDTGVSTTPGGGGWYIDVISTQWQGPPLASCARMWEAFPPIGGPPTWLSTPEHFEILASDEPYYYLAGRLISQKSIDASDCPSGGLLPNGYADVCGLEKARPIVQEWQNQFDNRIIDVANETGVPAQLMKNLFAQESQFWPGVYRVPFEFGLGQITDKGTDVIFLWNPSFFEQFCPLVLSEEACERGYLALSAEEQGILRGALALQAKADCPDCPAGVDLSNAYFTVMLFANTLEANCAQVSRTIFTATNSMAGRVASYEDLWRFTVANYHAGPGCLSFPIHQAWQSVGRLNWEEVKQRFTEPCKGVIPYVDEISR